jgi:integrase
MRRASSQFDAVHRHLPAPLQAVATFAYLTGWRIQGEILPLQWRQVDLRAGTVRLDPGTTTKNRDGHLFPDGDHLPALRQLLEAQRRVTTELETARPRVFHRNGKRIRGFRKAWANASESAECLGMIPHDLRPTAVRNLERAGVSRSVAMQLTGTRSRRCTAGTPLSAKGISAQDSTSFTHSAQGQGQGQLRGKGWFGGFGARPNV